MAEVCFTGQSGATWRYWTDQRLGEGSFGAVYAAEGRDGRPMAVKVVQKRRFGMFDDRLLRREVEIGRRVVESGAEMLLPVVDAADTSDELCLVMERADGALVDLVDKAKAADGLEETEVVSVMTDVAAGLEELHGIGIIHRDLKPANVLWHKGRWKLADFGIARDREIGTQDPTFVGFGSYLYMAREIWELRSPTAWTDLYALGCLAFELLTGSVPYPGNQETARVGHSLMTPLPEVPARDIVLKSLIAKLMDKCPKRRPQNARQVLDRLGVSFLSLSPAQLAIAGRLADRTAEESRLEAQQATYKETTETRRQSIEGARADLHEIVVDTIERLRMVELDARAKAGKASILLSSDVVRLRMDIWEVTETWPFPFRGDTMVAAGCVCIPGRPAMTSGPSISGRVAYSLRVPDRILSNLVYEKVDDRLMWQAYRFGTGSGGKLEGRTYSAFSSRDEVRRRERRGRPSDVLSGRDVARTRAAERRGRPSELNVSPRTVAEFTPEVLLEMFVEALDLSPRKSGSQ